MENPTVMSDLTFFRGSRSNTLNGTRKYGKYMEKPIVMSDLTFFRGVKVKYIKQLLKHPPIQMSLVAYDPLVCMCNARLSVVFVDSSILSNR